MVHTYLKRRVIKCQYFHYTRNASCIYDFLDWRTLALVSRVGEREREGGEKEGKERENGRREREKRK